MTVAEGRVAFITGGTKGIGLACARRLSADGHQVVVGSRNKPPMLDQGLHWVECDVSDASSVDGAFSWFEAEVGTAGVVVANAGVTRDTLLIRMAEDDFTEVLDVNLVGAFRVVKRALRPMMKARWGRLVLMSSVVGSTGQVGQSNYAASKAGLVGLARSVAREYATRGITINVVAPGPVASDMLADVPAAMREALIQAVPMNRVGRAEEVAAAVSYLVSEDASFVTGAVLPVDGGLGMAG